MHRRGDQHGTQLAPHDPRSPWRPGRRRGRDHLAHGRYRRGRTPSPDGRSGRRAGPSRPRPATGTGRPPPGYVLERGRFTPVALPPGVEDPQRWASARPTSTTAARSSAATTTWPPTPPAGSCSTGAASPRPCARGHEHPSPGDQQPRPDHRRLQQRQQRHLGPRRHPPRVRAGPRPLSAAGLPRRPRHQAFDINDRGQVVGEYEDADGRFHGYVWHQGRFRTIDVPGQSSTTATGINNRGQITGGTGPARGQGRVRAGAGPVHHLQGSRRPGHPGLRHQRPGPDHGPQPARPRRDHGLGVPAGRQGPLHRDQPARGHRHRGLRHQQPRPDRSSPPSPPPTDSSPMGRMA